MYNIPKGKQFFCRTHFVDCFAIKMNAFIWVRIMNIIILFSSRILPYSKYTRIHVTFVWQRSFLNSAASLHTLDMCLPSRFRALSFKCSSLYAVFKYTQRFRHSCSALLFANDVFAGKMQTHNVVSLTKQCALI